jgi:hypothetical protein
MPLVAVTWVTLALPLIIVVLAKVKFPTEVMVFPRPTVVLPMVTLPVAAAGACEIKTVPLEVRTLPEVPGAIKVTFPVPFPINRLLRVKVLKPVA